MGSVDIFLSFLWKQPYFFFSWVLVITFSICVHEYAHAWVAQWKGDDTAAMRGHLSLNPMVQMGPSSILLLLIAGIAWGAVPVNVSRMRGKTAEAEVAFAGPAANLLLMVLSTGLLVLAHSLSPWIRLPDAIPMFLELAADANALLFLFNLLPIPMFDGWTVAATFIPAMRRVDIKQAQSISWMLILVVWVTPAGTLLWKGGYALSSYMTMGWLTVSQLFV